MLKLDWKTSINSDFLISFLLEFEWIVILWFTMWGIEFAIRSWIIFWELYNLMAHYFGKVSMSNISWTDIDYGAFRASLFKKSKIYILLYILIEKLALESLDISYILELKISQDLLKSGLLFISSTCRRRHLDYRHSLCLSQNRTWAESKVCDGWDGGVTAFKTYRLLWSELPATRSTDDGMAWMRSHHRHCHVRG